MQLEGRSALVTGGGDGIGRAIAARFAREGARVVVADVCVERGEQTAEAIRKDGGAALFLQADVAREADVERMLREAASHLGGLHVLVNNAGLEITRRITEITEDEWDRVMAVNVKGVFFGCKHAIPLLLAHGGGSVINVASVAGIIGWPLQSALCASKGAVLSLTRALAQELKGTPLRFNAICPGLVRTAAGERLVESYDRDYGIPILSMIEARQGRMATVDEVAAAAVFLASDASSFVNGHALLVDNGAAG